MRLAWAMAAAGILACAGPRVHGPGRAYTPEAEIARIKAPCLAAGVRPRIELVRPCLESKRPSEGDNCVWHAGYGHGPRFTHGFSKLLNGQPNRFLVDSGLAHVGPGGDRELPIRIKVEKLRLKTWVKGAQDYRSCLARFRYLDETGETEITAVVTLPGSGTVMAEHGYIQALPVGDNVVLLAVSDNIKRYLAARGYIRP